MRQSKTCKKCLICLILTWLSHFLGTNETRQMPKFEPFYRGEAQIFGIVWHLGHPNRHRVVSHLSHFRTKTEHQNTPLLCSVRSVLDTKLGH